MNNKELVFTEEQLKRNPAADEIADEKLDSVTGGTSAAEDNLFPITVSLGRGTGIAADTIKWILGKEGISPSQETCQAISGALYSYKNESKLGKDVLEREVNIYFTDHDSWSIVEKNSFDV